MKIYVICPVRRCTGEQMDVGRKYCEEQRKEGHVVFYPPDDAKQDSQTGFSIIVAEKAAILEADEIHVLWDVNSKGSHFDLGMAYMADKPIKFVHLFEPDGEGKSYVKAITLAEEVRQCRIT